jgi:hypothetical protein
MGRPGRSVPLSTWVTNLDDGRLSFCLRQVAAEIPMSAERRRIIVREAARRLAEPIGPSATTPNHERTSP